MALEIVYGPYLKTAKEKFFSGIKENLENKKNVLYIVPEQASFDADKNVVEELGEKFSHICETINFKRMAQMVNSQYSKGKNEYISEEIRDLILFDIIKKNASSLKSLKGRRKNPDSILIFKNIISEFRTHLIDCEVLEKIKDSFADVPALSDKINDLYLIIKEYDKYLKNNFSGYGDEFRELTENIRKNELYKDYEIYIDGFIHFSPSEYDVIKALFSNCRNMHVTLLLDNTQKKEKGDLFYITYKTFEKLNLLSKENNSDFVYTYADEKSEKKILDIFYGNLSEKNGNDIKTFDCINYSDEVRNAIYEIKKCIKEGYSYSDICVFCGNPDLYSSYIERLFLNSGIPFFMDKKVSISKNPVCKFFMNVLNCVRDSYNYEDVSCYIKSILFMTGNFDEISIFENYISTFRIKKSVFQNKKEWQETYDIIKLNNSFFKVREKSVLKTYEKYILPLTESFIDVKRKNKACVYTGALRKYIKKTGFENKLRTFIDSLSDFNDKQLYINAYNTFINGIKHIEKILGDEAVLVEDYVLLISQMLDIYKIGVLPNTVDAVNVTDLERGRTQEKKIVFILGFNDGVVPENISDTDYLSDVEREEIERVTQISLPQSTWKNNSSYLALYRGMISYTDRLYVSKSMRDAEAKELTASFIWSDIQSCTSENFVFEKRFVNISEATKYAIENNFNIFEEKNENEEFLNKVKSYNPKLMEDIENTESEGYFNPEKKVSKKLLDSLYQKKLGTSVSRLETYQKCAYSYFMRYLLKINAPDTPDYNYAKTGTIVHNVLDAFTSYMQKDGKTWADVSEDYVKEITEKAVRGEIVNNFPDCNIFSPKTKYLMKKLARISKTAIMYIREHYINGYFTPIGYEIPITPEGIQPLSFALSDGSIMEIYGRIDRADIFAGKDDTVFVRIIDYKQKSKSIDFALVKEGIRIQLFVYLKTLVENGAEYLDIKNVLLPGAAFYMAYDNSMKRFDKRPASEEVVKELKKAFMLNGIVLNDERVLYAIDKELEGANGYSSDIFDVSINKKGEISTKNLLYKTQFDMLLNDCEELIRKTGNRIINGEFYIRPYSMLDKTACDYCDYKSVCQFDKTMYPYKTVYALGKDAYFEKIEKIEKKEDQNG